MSIWTSLRTGASGLQAHGEAISTVGDNIANASTVGFRGSRASFQDVLGGNAPNGQRMGAGVRLGGVDTLHNQGAIQQTGATLDMAIRGNGFFILNGNHDGAEGSYYTRDGRFNLNSEGVVVNGEGLRVQGYMLQPSGQLSATLSDLQVGGTSPPNATTELAVSMNLDSGSIAPALPWDPANASATSNSSAPTTVYDSLGQAHRADVYFITNGAGTWQWHALVDGSEVTGGTAGVPQEIAAGTLTFTPNGALDTETTTASSADFLNATPGQVIAFDFGDSITTDTGTGQSGTVQYAGANSITGLVQNGYGSGELTNLLIGDDGTVTGMFSNGQSRAVARVGLASFQSEQGLVRAGSQLFLETPDSGQALVGTAASGTRGAISAGSLENSNVDLGNELVSLIAYQRAFQANARTISTADEMLAEIANLKR
ncbi:MAG: flagellar hook protein FlgE [Deltaproteobacteria bacterium]|nr:flagellar hook protein FlgE [Deltaproteobacteria bacterium]